MKKLVLALLVLSFLPSLGTGQGEFKPIFGPELERSGSLVVISLSDAKGKPLVVGLDETESVFCWRHVGEYHRTAYARFEHEHSRIVCGGSGDRGLEPGRYTLESSIAGYGQFRIEFEVRKGQSIQRSVKLPNWRRLLTFEVVDEEGEPFAHLLAEPSYSYDWQQVRGFENRHLTEVLRDPPSTPRGAGVGLGGRGRSGFQKPRAYRTDSGKIYMNVYAGHNGYAVIRLDSITKESFSEDFSGDQWNEPRKIVFARPADFEKALAKRVVANDSDPGGRIAAGIAIEAEDICRVKITVDCDAPVYPVFEDGSAARHLGGNRWEANLVRGSTARIRLVDGGLYAGEWQEIKLPLKGEAAIRCSAEGIPLAVSTSSPTLSAWFDFIRIGDRDSLEAYSSKVGDWQVGAPREFTTLMTDAQHRQWKVSGCDVLVGGGYEQEFRRNAVLFEGTGGRNLGDIWVRWGSGACWVEQLEVPDIGKDGKVRLKVQGQGLVLRVVGPNGEGLVEAEGSLFLAKDDALAQQMRQVEQELQKEGKRPQLNKLKIEQADMIPRLHEKSEDADISFVIGEDVAKLYPTREMRLRLAQNGTWYSTRNKAQADIHGFIVQPKWGLQPGTRYVLYLWTASRDDLEPNTRLEFEAAVSGVTDLGVIRLPALTRK